MGAFNGIWLLNGFTSAASLLFLLFALQMLIYPSGAIINSQPANAQNGNKDSGFGADMQVARQINKPMGQKQQWEGSGAVNPDDEDGDVDDEEGSGGGSIEGSGGPPEEIQRNGNQRSSEDRKHMETAVDARMPPSTGSEQGQAGKGQAVYANTTLVAISSSAEKGTWPPPPTSATTTTSSSRAPPTNAAPTLVRPLTTTPMPPTQAATTTTAASPRSQRPPFVQIDLTSTLEHLRPGIFAFGVGGVVVLLLLLILVISYLVYRLKKRDEGTYICEEPHQQAHYSYAYQKASIKEFYA